MDNHLFFGYKKLNKAYQTILEIPTLNGNYNEKKISAAISSIKDHDGSIEEKKALKKFLKDANSYYPNSPQSELPDPTPILPIIFDLFKKKAEDLDIENNDIYNLNTLNEILTFIDFYRTQNIVEQTISPTLKKVRVKSREIFDKILNNESMTRVTLCKWYITIDTLHTRKNGKHFFTKNKELFSKYQKVRDSLFKEKFSEMERFIRALPWKSQQDGSDDKEALLKKVEIYLFRFKKFYSKQEIKRSNHYKSLEKAKASLSVSKSVKPYFECQKDFQVGKLKQELIEKTSPLADSLNVTVINESIINLYKAFSFFKRFDKSTQKELKTEIEKAHQLIQKKLQKVLAFHVNKLSKAKSWKDAKPYLISFRGVADVIRKCNTSTRKALANHIVDLRSVAANQFAKKAAEYKNTADRPELDQWHIDLLPLFQSKGKNIFATSDLSKVARERYEAICQAQADAEKALTLIKELSLESSLESIQEFSSLLNTLTQSVDIPIDLMNEINNQKCRLVNSFIDSIFPCNPSKPDPFINGLRGLVILNGQKDTNNEVCEHLFKYLEDWTQTSNPKVVMTYAEYLVNHDFTNKDLGYAILNDYLKKAEGNHEAENFNLKLIDKDILNSIYELAIDLHVTKHKDFKDLNNEYNKYKANFEILQQISSQRKKPKNSNNSKSLNQPNPKSTESLSKIKHVNIEEPIHVVYKANQLTQQILKQDEITPENLIAALNTIANKIVDFKGQEKLIRKVLQKAENDFSKYLDNNEIKPKNALELYDVLIRIHGSLQTNPSRDTLFLRDFNLELAKKVFTYFFPADKDDKTALIESSFVDFLRIIHAFSKISHEIYEGNLRRVGATILVKTHQALKKFQYDPVYSQLLKIYLESFPAEILDQLFDKQIVHLATMLSKEHTTDDSFHPLLDSYYEIIYNTNKESEPDISEIKSLISEIYTTYNKIYNTNYPTDYFIDSFGDTLRQRVRGLQQLGNPANLYILSQNSANNASGINVRTGTIKQKLNSCTFNVCQFIASTLSENNPSIDKIIINGESKYNMAGYAEGNKKTDFEEAAHSFKQLKKWKDFSDYFSNNTNKRFQKILSLLDFCERTQSPFGLGFTYNGFSYGLAYKDGNYYIFDSHGDKDMGGNTKGKAFIISTTSKEIAANVLIKLMPYPEQGVSYIKLKDIINKAEDIEIAKATALSYVYPDHEEISDTDKFKNIKDKTSLIDFFYDESVKLNKFNFCDNYLLTAFTLDIRTDNNNN